MPDDRYGSVEEHSGRDLLAEREYGGPVEGWLASFEIYRRSRPCSGDRFDTDGPGGYGQIAYWHDTVYRTCKRYAAKNPFVTAMILIGYRVLRINTDCLHQGRVLRFYLRDVTGRLGQVP